MVVYFQIFHTLVFILVIFFQGSALLFQQDESLSHLSCKTLGVMWKLVSWLKLQL